MSKILECSLAAEEPHNFVRYGNKMKSIPRNLSDGDESGIINVLPPIIYFSGLTQSEINYSMHTLSSIDEKAQLQLVPIIQEEIILIVSTDICSSK